MKTTGLYLVSLGALVTAEGVLAGLGRIPWSWALTTVSCAGVGYVFGHLLGRAFARRAERRQQCANIYGSFPGAAAVPQDVTPIRRTRAVYSAPVPPSPTPRHFHHYDDDGPAYPSPSLDFSNLISGSVTDSSGFDSSPSSPDTSSSVDSGSIGGGGDFGGGGASGSWDPPAGGNDGSS